MSYKNNKSGVTSPGDQRVHEIILDAFSSKLLIYGGPGYYAVWVIQLWHLLKNTPLSVSLLRKYSIQC
jgi:hypothetical protein